MNQTVKPLYYTYRHASTINFTFSHPPFLYSIRAYQTHLPTLLGNRSSYPHKIILTIVPNSGKTHSWLKIGRLYVKSQDYQPLIESQRRTPCTIERYAEFIVYPSWLQTISVFATNIPLLVPQFCKRHTSILTLRDYPHPSTLLDHRLGVQRKLQSSIINMLSNLSSIAYHRV